MFKVIKVAIFSALVACFLHQAWGIFLKFINKAKTISIDTVDATNNGQRLPVIIICRRFGYRVDRMEDLGMDHQQWAVFPRGSGGRFLPAKNREEMDRWYERSTYSLGETVLSVSLFRRSERRNHLIVKNGSVMESVAASQQSRVYQVHGEGFGQCTVVEIRKPLFKSDTLILALPPVKQTIFLAEDGDQAGSLVS